MALTEDTGLEFADSARSSETQAYILVNTTVVFAGSYVGIVDASGLVESLSDSVGFEPLGFATEGATGDTTTAGDETQIPVKTGGGVGKDFTVIGAGSDADVGELVFATDDNTFTLTPTANIPAIGVVDRHITGTTVDVKFFSYETIRNA